MLPAAENKTGFQRCYTVMIIVFSQTTLIAVTFTNDQVLKQARNFRDLAAALIWTRHI